ncbi:hypothetical protein LXL04_015898 [Taraxacum kok-saghyz]
MLSMLFNIIELSFVIYTDQAGNQENQKITDILVRTSPYIKSSAKRSPPVIVNQDNSKAGTSKSGNLKKKGKKIQDLRTPTKKITQESRQSPRLQLLEYSKCVTPLQSDDSLVKGKKATENNNQASIKEAVSGKKERKKTTKRTKKKSKINRLSKRKKPKIPIKKHDMVSLRTRLSPKKFYDVVASLNNEQKHSVREMGLGSLLKIATNGITGKLARFVVNSFNPNDMKMHLPKGLVHDLLGLPMGGELLYCIQHCAADLPALVEWKAQFAKAVIRPTDLEEKFAESADSGVLFNMNFILLFINTLCELNKNGSCKTSALPHLLSVVQTKAINWCAYVVNCLKVSKTTWDDNDKDDYFCGPLLFLLLAYLQFMRNLKNTPRQTPALHLWDLGTMIQRERA